MKPQRPPAVAGTFYPADPERLRSELEGYLVAETPPQPAVAVICPHAGTVYSGPTAGRTFARVVVPETAVVVGVNHRMPTAPPLALFDSGTWETPLGTVPVDEELACSWMEESPEITPDPAAHAWEHSLEVEIPFLQMRNAGVRIVPLMVTTQEASVLASAGKGLARAVRKSGDDVLLVASTDMTHFESESSARARDRKAIERILAMDPDGLLEVVLREGITMCGVAPTALVLHAAADLGARTAELVDYRTSGDVTGDRSEVVAYAGFVVR